MNREKLEGDLAKVKSYIRYLSENENRNFDVTGPSTDYLMPFFWFDQEEGGFVRPIENSNGLFMYYLRIKTVLEKALETGSLSEDELPRGAPEYLEELVEI